MKEVNRMQEQRKKSVFKQVCLIIFVTCASILFILNVEENSDIQSVIVFFIGMAFASSSQFYGSKVDVYINYLLILKMLLINLELMMSQRMYPGFQLLIS